MDMRPLENTQGARELGGAFECIDKVPPNRSNVSLHTGGREILPPAASSMRGLGATMTGDGRPYFQWPQQLGRWNGSKFVVSPNCLSEYFFVIYFRKIG